MTPKAAENRKRRLLARLSGPEDLLTDTTTVGYRDRNIVIDKNKPAVDLKRY